MSSPDIDGVAQEDLEEKKVMKVKVPTELHLRLHTLKILGDQTISQTVEVALRQYFENLGPSGDGTGELG